MRTALELTGEALHGRDWKNKLARDLDVSRTTIVNWLEKPETPEQIRNCKRLLETKCDTLVVVLDILDQRETSEVSKGETNV